MILFCIKLIKVESIGELMTKTNSQNPILNLIQKGESETVEFKESFNRETLETLFAFANTKGGVLMIGIRDKGEPSGVAINHNILKEWVNQIAQGTGLQPSLEVKRFKDREIVLIHVKESTLNRFCFKAEPINGLAAPRVR